MTSEAVVRVAEPGDLELVRAFGWRVVVPYYESIGIPEFGPDMLRAYWDTDGQVNAIGQKRVLLAEIDGVTVGVTEFDRFDGEPVIWKLYVDATCRGQGVGRQLIDAVIARLSGDDRTLLIEHASENEQAAAAYDRLGFEVAWVDEGDAPGSTTVWRRRDLHPSAPS